MNNITLIIINIISFLVFSLDKPLINKPIVLNKNKIQLLGDTVSKLSNNIMVIYQDQKNNYWFGSWQDGLYKYDGKLLLHFTSKHGLTNNRVEEIKEDKHGNIFINTSAGLYKYDGKKIVFIPPALTLTSFTKNWKLSPDDLWFKTSIPRHICRFAENQLITLEIPKIKIGEEFFAKNPSAIDPYSVYSIYKDTYGNMWFGTGTLGVFRYNGKSLDWITENDLTELHNGPSNGVRSIIEDKDGYFWFNADYRYKIYNKTAANEKAFYLRQKSIGSLDGKRNGILNEYLSIAKDNDNNLWIVTYQNGVWKYDGKCIKHYSIQKNEKDINLFYIYKDNQGNLWLGTQENGVFKFNGKTFENKLN